MQKIYFKRIFVTIICLCLVFSVVGCSKSKITYKPGDYTATGQGKDGPVKIQVTFSDSAITDIKVLESNETPGVGDEALKLVAEEIKTNQSLAVDVVTGATYSSNAMLTAVEDCVKQAGADPAALKVEK